MALSKLLDLGTKYWIGTYSNRDSKGEMQKSISTKKMDKDNMSIIEVYADDIIFRSDGDRMSHKFSKDMQSEFEMSLFGELNFFLVLQKS